MAEAGNFAAYQRLISAAGVPTHPTASPYWPYPGAAAVAHHAQNDLFYRQAAAASAAAVTLQKPMPYRLYPPTAMMLAGPSTPISALAASTSLGGYYAGGGNRDSPNSEAMESNVVNRNEQSRIGMDLAQQQQQQQRERSKSLERTSPPAQSARETSSASPTSVCKADSDDESIHDV